VTAALVKGAAVDAIVIGASAGGIDALSVLLPAVARGYHGVILIVLHLPRERPSMLVDIFGPKCALAVREAEDKEPVAAGTVYFAPSDYHLLVDRGPELALSTDAPVNFSRPSIDVLFESAAEVYGRRLLGVILTGASEDGAAGLEAVSRAGGTTCVQDPATAHARLMVDAALRRVQVDHVLGLAELGAFLHTLTAAHAVEEGSSR
jgi:two-component system chemotaxis response regulator CheB